MVQYKSGDLLWVRTGSYGFWPGQVMDLSIATASARRMQKPGHILLSFFGDSSFGWYPMDNPRQFIDFEEGYEEKRQQKHKTVKGKVRHAKPWLASLP